MVDQHEFWRDFRNHAELKQLLKKHGVLTAPAEFDLRVEAVAKCWMKLAVSHLREAKGDCDLQFRRSFYSRGYYAVYNASKSVRYLVYGQVSDKGDDHQKVSSLPDDFPHVGKWGGFLRDMYKHRLVADYDGWPNSLRALNTDMSATLDKCSDFIKISKRYIRTKFGFQL